MPKLVKSLRYDLIAFGFAAITTPLAIELFTLFLGPYPPHTPLRYWPVWVIVVWIGARLSYPLVKRQSIAISATCLHFLMFVLAAGLWLALEQGVSVSGISDVMRGGLFLALITLPISGWLSVLLTWLLARYALGRSKESLVSGRKETDYTEALS